MKKSLVSMAMAAAMGLVGASANAAFLDFTITENSVPGALANSFVADKLNGGYTEYLAPTSATTFAAAAVGNIGQAFRNDGTVLVPATQLSGLGSNVYSLYAVFQAAGNIVGPNQFEGTSGSFFLYIDPSQNTTFTSFNSTASALLTPTADAGTDSDDYLVAFSKTGTGTGNLNGPPGAFDILFTNFQLAGFGNLTLGGDAAPSGNAYFTAPNPFHMSVQVNGDYDAFESVSGGGVANGGTSRVTGDVSAVFVVPEPGSLALMGVAFAGFGLFQRRRKI